MVVNRHGIFEFKFQLGSPHVTICEEEALSQEDAIESATLLAPENRFTPLTSVSTCVKL